MLYNGIYCKETPSKSYSPFLSPPSKFPKPLTAEDHSSSHQPPARVVSLEITHTHIMPEHDESNATEGGESGQASIRGTKFQGSTEVSEGTLTLEFEFHLEPDSSGAFDAFLTSVLSAVDYNYREFLEAYDSARESWLDTLPEKTQNSIGGKALSGGPQTLWEYFAGTKQGFSNEDRTNKH